ncbi:MAG: YkgJ family cysteine cluster protein [Vampirovibrionales bacterium]
MLQAGQPEFSFESAQTEGPGRRRVCPAIHLHFCPLRFIDDVQAEFPDLVADMLSQTELKDVHFYHCPYLGQDNRCTIYNDPRRPKICDEYPQTPDPDVQKLRLPALANRLHCRPC